MTVAPTNWQGFTFNELLCSEGLVRLDHAFLAYLKNQNAEQHEQLLHYRNETKPFGSVETSELLIRCAIVLESFLAELFRIKEAVAVSQLKTTSHNPIAIFKKYFVLRRAKKEIHKINSFPLFKELNEWLDHELKKAPLQTEDKELAIALLATEYVEQVEKYAQEIEKLVQWCAHALVTAEGRELTAHWTSFNVPERIEPLNLVRRAAIANDPWERSAASESELRLRDGFKLTDPRMDARQIQDEINYCIYCHDHEGDFCSKGFPVKKGDPEQGFKKNAFDITLTGCPLEEKISEMHVLKKAGHTLASLAMVMIDNPMCPATGHRICNDCMKACIYQKQDPVNIPQIETRVLTDVLELPWGVEIYDLLTRWNPLRKQQWAMKPYNGLKVMIAGMGPAGFTLAHHLLLEGFAVVGFDGLKIEPLPEKLIKGPIYRFADLEEPLDERVMAGFGGVAEYGITVRWNKNFLKLIYLSLLRRPYFQVFGSVRFGGTITIEDAWEMGFDHFVVAVGAGLPKALPIPGSLAPGMRQANDFLMALQLGNAAKSNSLTHLQIRLPAVVIGGGLTGVDTATELQAYYITQVEKVLARYEMLRARYGQDKIDGELDAESRETLSEYLSHGRAVRAERQRAQAHRQRPDFIKLIRAWGGVTIVYRRSMQESPAYLNNHEELQKALQEGIYYCEGLEPVSVEINQHGHAAALICRKRKRQPNHEWETTHEKVQLPAHSILVATGTQPNTAYEFEHRGTFKRLHLQYQHYEEIDDALHLAQNIKHCKEPQFGPFTSYHQADRRVSLIGDTHPVFHGSVVKAIASGLRTYPKILAILQERLGHKGSETEYQQFAHTMTQLFHAHVHSIVRKTKNVIEITVHAPIAAKHFKPGQFYRLQNYETFAAHVEQTLLQMEPLALAAATCDYTQGRLTFLVTETNATTKLCALLKPGDPVSLMGPTGVRAKVPARPETVLIIGNASSFAFVRSYGNEMRASGNRVLYAGHFNDSGEVYCQREVEQATDAILWLTREGPPMAIRRDSDRAKTGEDVVQALLQEATALSLTEVDRIFIIGDADLLRRFQAARKTSLKPYLLKNPKVFGSVYGNMQCMLKGVCAQCLQWQIDPETGQRTKAVFACSWQDQPLEIIDIAHIDSRQSQNRLLEHLNNVWVDHVFHAGGIQRI